MSKFEELVKPDTSRLIILFKLDDRGTPMFQWGLAGQTTLTSLLGGIVCVQAGESEVGDCPELAAVLAWDEGEKRFSFFCHKDIPREPLLGMLDIIKFTLISTHMTRTQSSQQVILGPDGRPAGKRPLII